ncbi:hypothetical protein GF402_02170 [Candidatus Fermentibacteria bacterium]|nr:hypothetical protein [Candidatus Fermentibacteria bacterium]
MSGRSIKTLRRLVIFSAGGVLLLFLVFYVLLVTGSLTGPVSDLVGKLSSSAETTVSIEGLRTDLFWKTTVDRIRVTDDEGLVVEVDSARVIGSMTDLLWNRHVDTLTVGCVYIALPPPGPDTEPDTLDRILEDVRSGFYTATDRIGVRYGILLDHRGTLLDSMYLEGSISLGEGMELALDSVHVRIREVGGVSGRGLLGMRENIAWARDFRASAAMGSLVVDGTFSGPDGSYDFSVSGRVGPRIPGVPFDLSMGMSATVGGRLAHPTVAISTGEGSANLAGETTDFSVDSVRLSTDSVEVFGLQASRSGLYATLSGALDLDELAWRGSADLSFDHLDPRSLTESMPEGNCTGWATVSATGNLDGPRNLSVHLRMDSSIVGPIRVLSTDVRGGMQGSGWNCYGTVEIPEGRVRMDLRGRIGPDGLPHGYQGTLQALLDGESMVRILRLESIEELRTVRLSAEIEGDREEVSGTGNLLVSGLVIGPLELEDAELEGRASISSGSRTAEATLEIPVLRVGGRELALNGTFRLDQDSAFISGLSLEEQDGYRADMTARSLLGDSLRFALEELHVGRSKLILVTKGKVSGLMTSGFVRLDSLWVMTPHGWVEGSAVIGPGDSLGADLKVNNLDLSGLGGVVRPLRGIAGVGDFRLSASRPRGALSASLRGRVVSPAFGPYISDSLTMDASMSDSMLVVEGVYSWTDGVRSGIRLGARDFWNRGRLIPALSDLTWMELELSNIGDWLFYALPIPIKTRGASISAHAEYWRNEQDEPEFELHAVAQARQMIITTMDHMLPNVTVNLLYGYPSEGDYSARLSLTSGDESNGILTAQAMVDVVRHFPSPRIGDYYMGVDFDNFRTILGSFADVILDGRISSGGHGLSERPEITGDLIVKEGFVGVPPSSEGSGGSSGPELPFDLRIALTSERGLWFRNPMADLELYADLVVLTQDRIPTVSGRLTVRRGNVYLLQKSFDITEGYVEFAQGTPLRLRLYILAETRIRGLLDHKSYLISVQMTGPPDNPDVVLSGTGPDGELAQEDIIALLASGLTYAQLQQLDSGAMESGVGELAQGYLGKLLAKSLREDIGFDALELSPELLSDTTSFQVNVGKYVLPDLFISYEGDVFSSEPGTISAQYFIGNKLYMLGSSRSTLHGDLEPSMELHYTYNY